MNFGYVDWVLEQKLLLMMITIPIAFLLVYKILNTEMSYLKKGMSVFSTILLVFIILPSLGYIIFLNSYIQDFRSEFKDFMEEEGRYSIEIEDVEITNNNGNYIPKFSKKDEDKYVKVNYMNKGKQERKIIKSHPKESKDDKYRLTFVYLDEDYEIVSNKYEEFLYKIRDILGFNDKDKLEFKKGAYDFEMEVPKKDFDRIKSEMGRKEK